MATRDEDTNVWCVLSESIAPDIRKRKRITHLLLVGLVDALDSFILLGESPHFKLHRLASECSNVEFEASFVEVEHG